MKIFVLGFLLLLSGCEKATIMNIEKPSYYVKLTMENALYLISINGFELERDFDGNSLRTDIPINHLLKKGENTIALMVPPESYHEGEFDPLQCMVEVRVKGFVNGKNVDFKVTDIIHTPEILNGRYEPALKSSSSGTFSFSQSGETIIDENGTLVVSDITLEDDYFGEGADVLQRSFTTDLTFPVWLFFQGEKYLDLPLINEAFEKNENQLWPKLEKLQSLFDSQDIEEILSVFEARSKEYDLAFYKEPGSTLKELENSLLNTFSSGYEQIIRDKSKMQLVVSADARVGTLVNAASMNGTIMFDAGDDFVISYNAYWIRKDGEWIIAR